MRETGQHLLLVLTGFQLALVPPGVRHLLLIRHLQRHALQTRGAMLPLLQLLIRHPALLFNLFHHLRVDLPAFLALVLVSLQAPRQPGEQPPTQDGLPRGGRTIGYLERLLIFLLVMAGQFSAIGFLVTAKSILRFGTVSNDREATEYVIIGTLASFGWAIALAMATDSLLGGLPPLETFTPMP